MFQRYGWVSRLGAGGLHGVAQSLRAKTSASENVKNEDLPRSSLKVKQEEFDSVHINRNPRSVELVHDILSQTVWPRDFLQSGRGSRPGIGLVCGAIFLSLSCCSRLLLPHLYPLSFSLPHVASSSSECELRATCSQMAANNRPCHWSHVLNKSNRKSWLTALLVIH